MLKHCDTNAVFIKRIDFRDVENESNDIDVGMSQFVIEF